MTVNLKPLPMTSFQPMEFLSSMLSNINLSHSRKEHEVEVHRIHRNLRILYGALGLVALLLIIVGGVCCIKKRNKAKKDREMAATQIG